MMQDVFQLLIVDLSILLIVCLIMLFVLFKTIGLKQSKVTLLLLSSGVFLLASAISFISYLLLYIDTVDFATQIMYRAFVFSDSLHLLFFCWAIAVFKQGESRWNDLKNLLLVGILISLIMFGSLAPDAIQTQTVLGISYVVLGPLLSMIYYPLRIFLPVVALLLSLECVSMFKNIDYNLARLSFTILLGSIIIIIGTTIGQIQLYLQGTPFVPFIMLSSSVGLGMALYVASQHFETHPRPMTLAALVRIKTGLSQSQTMPSFSELEWIIAFIKKHDLPGILARLLTTKGLALIFNSNYISAEDVLTKALEIAKTTSDSDLSDDVSGFIQIVNNRLAVDKDSGPVDTMGADGPTDIYEALVYLEEREHAKNLARLKSYLDKTIHFVRTSMS